jgi:hypothetical protein
VIEFQMVSQTWLILLKSRYLREINARVDVDR